MAHFYKVYMFYTITYEYLETCLKSYRSTTLILIQHARMSSISAFKFQIVFENHIVLQKVQIKNIEINEVTKI